MILVLTKANTGKGGGGALPYVVQARIDKVQGKCELKHLYCILSCVLTFLSAHIMLSSTY